LLDFLHAGFGHVRDANHMNDTAILVLQSSGVHQLHVAGSNRAWLIIA
jgi:hypothetical protein